MGHTDDESQISAAFRESIQRELKRIGRFAKGNMPDGMGFALWMFDYGPHGYTAYASSAQRDDIIRMMRKWLDMVDPMGLVK